MVLDVFCKTEDCRAFLGASSHSFSFGSCRDFRWLFVAQAEETFLWGLEQVLLSATVSGSLEIPLVTSFLVSVLGALAPLRNDLYNDEGQEGRGKRDTVVNRVTCKCHHGTDAKYHKAHR